MMERECYRQGLETLKSAVSAFKLSTGCVKISARPDVPSDDAVAPDNQRQAVLVLLKQTNRRSSKPQKSHLHSMPLRVVTQNGQSLAMTSNATTSSASLQHTLIRLETTDDLDLLEADSDLTAAVILFDFAVSYLFRAMESVSSSANSCDTSNKKRRKESSAQTKCIHAALKLL